MNPELLIERVQYWSGITHKRDAERAILATLKALRQALFDDEANALAQELPEPFAPSMRGGGAGAVVNTEQLYRCAARSEGVPVRIAVEHVQVVCQALASLLPAPAVTRLSRALPTFAMLFEVPDRASHPMAVLSPAAGTLAEGRPGSEHPLSEARPPVRDAETFGDARPSSAHPLSEARPGSEHPLSEAKPLRTR